MTGTAAPPPGPPPAPRAARWLPPLLVGLPIVYLGSYVAFSLRGFYVGSGFADPPDALPWIRWYPGFPGRAPWLADGQGPGRPEVAWYYDTPGHAETAWCRIYAPLLALDRRWWHPADGMGSRLEPPAAPAPAAPGGGEAERETGSFSRQ